MLSKTSISSPSALAATAGEEFTGVSRVPPVILGLLFSMQPAESTQRLEESSGLTPHTLQSHSSLSLCASAATGGQRAEHRAPTFEDLAQMSPGETTQTTEACVIHLFLIRRGKVDAGGSSVMFRGCYRPSAVRHISVCRAGEEPGSCTPRTEAAVQVWEAGDGVCPHLERRSGAAAERTSI